MITSPYHVLKEPQWMIGGYGGCDITLYLGSSKIRLIAAHLIIGTEVVSIPITKLSTDSSQFKLSYSRPMIPYLAPLQIIIRLLISISIIIIIIISEAGQVLPVYITWISINTMSPSGSKCGWSVDMIIA